MSIVFLPFVMMLWLFAIGLAVVSTILWVWMLVEVATKEPSQGNDKVVWILVVLFTHWIGALIYFLVRRPERIRLYGH